MEVRVEFVSVIRVGLVLNKEETESLEHLATTEGLSLTATIGRVIDQGLVELSGDLPEKVS